MFHAIVTDSDFSNKPKKVAVGYHTDIYVTEDSLVLAKLTDDDIEKIADLVAERLGDYKG